MIQSLARLAQQWVEGKLPSEHAKWWNCANLTPLRKADDGVRPVAVGETILRMVGKFLLVDPSTIDSIRGLLPLQCGVRTPNACEMIAIGLQSLLNNDLLQ